MLSSLNLAYVKSERLLYPHGLFSQLNAFNTLPSPLSLLAMLMCTLPRARESGTLPLRCLLGPPTPIKCDGNQAFKAKLRLWVPFYF